MVMRDRSVYALQWAGGFTPFQQTQSAAFFLSKHSLLAVRRCSVRKASGLAQSLLPGLQAADCAGHWAPSSSSTAAQSRTFSWPLRARVSVVSLRQRASNASSYRSLLIISRNSLVTFLLY